MSHDRPVHIFHILRYDGSALFVHPFRGDEATMQILERASVEGLYGAEPEVSALTQFRNELYGLAERAIRAWDAETRFIPRFVVSSAVFLVTFLFLSVVVRDPLPLLDELLLALAAAIGSYLMLRKRGSSSEAVERKRIALRSRIDIIVFSESTMVHRLEQMLHAHEAEDDASRLLLEERGMAFDPEHSATAAEALEYLGSRFRQRYFRRQERRLRRNEVRSTQRVLRWAEKKKIDLPLFCFYLRLKRHFSTAKVRS